MSPTLLELLVAVFLLWVAWQLATRIAPPLIASFLSFWRGLRPPVDPNHRPSEKNVTPPGTIPPQSHGRIRK